MATPHSEAGHNKLITTTLNHPQGQGSSVSILIRPTKFSRQPGTDIVKFHKQQIPRYPVPLNKLRIIPCLRCCICMLVVLAIILAIAGMIGDVFYSVYLPKAPKYSIENLSIHGFNVTSTCTFSPGMDITVRALNPNTKIGIYPAKGGSIQVSHCGIGELCTGTLPVFYQPSKNITIFQTQLRSTDPSRSDVASPSII